MNKYHDALDDILDRPIAFNPSDEELGEMGIERLGLYG